MPGAFVFFLGVLLWLGWALGMGWSDGEASHSSLGRQVFPRGSFRNYQIMNLYLTQGQPMSAMMVHAVSHDTHAMYYVLPYAMPPLSERVFKSDRAFATLVSPDFRTMVVGNSDGLQLWSRTDMSQHTMGSWHHRQSFAIPSKDLPWTLGWGDKRVVASNTRGVFFLERSPDSSSYVMIPFMLDEVRADFRVYPHGASGKWFALGSPFYRETDGVVDIYCEGERPHEMNLTRILAPPQRGTFFGGDVMWLRDFLLVSAPFAQKGMGEVYVYARTREAVGEVVQTLRSNHPSFGLELDSSYDESFLLISHQHGVDVWGRQGHTFIWERTIEGPTPVCMAIDDMENLAAATESAVYFSVLEDPTN